MKSFLYKDMGLGTSWDRQGERDIRKKDVDDRAKARFALRRDMKKGGRNMHSVTSLVSRRRGAPTDLPSKRVCTVLKKRPLRSRRGISLTCLPGKSKRARRPAVERGYLCLTILKRPSVHHRYREQKSTLIILNSKEQAQQDSNRWHSAAERGKSQARLLL